MVCSTRSIHAYIYIRILYNTGACMCVCKASASHISHVENSATVTSLIFHNIRNPLFNRNFRDTSASPPSPHTASGVYLISGPGLVVRIIINTFLVVELPANLCRYVWTGVKFKSDFDISLYTFSWIFYFIFFLFTNAYTVVRNRNTRCLYYIGTFNCSLARISLARKFFHASSALWCTYLVFGVKRW